MPPRTRTAKSTKASKENAVVHISNAKSKGTGTGTKSTRKPLADKTNSASDDNGSEFPTKKPSGNSESKTEKENQTRPRRERRVPKRFVETKVLSNVSVNQDPVTHAHEKSKTANSLTSNQKHGKSQAKSNNTPKSPFKTPEKSLSSSLVANRPTRIHRLPSKFEDHSISPNKFIPVKPCFASTPLVEHNNGNLNKPALDKKKVTPSQPLIKEKDKNSNVTKIVPDKKQESSNQLPRKVITSTKRNSNVTKIVPDKKQESPNQLPRKVIAPTKRLIYAPETISINAELERPLRSKRAVAKAATIKTGSPIKSCHNVKCPAEGKKRLPKNISFRLLEKKGESPKQKEVKLGVYEFTFDPNEEPPPQKKKRKRAVRKKQAPKPRTVTFKSAYDTNISKKLEILRKAVMKTSHSIVEASQGKTTTQELVTAPKPTNITVPANNAASTNACTVSSVTNNLTQEPEPPMDFDSINYSPIASPSNSPRPHVKMSAINETRDLLRTTRSKSLMRPNSHDPLNLCEELSYFDEVPVASSSMNLNRSARDPLATPWRVEFSALPIKWQANTYVKSNMTPAVESSFINPNDVQNKHVYTNILVQNDSYPDIVTNDKETTNLKQPSIIEFLREAARKSANKKTKKRSLSPTKVPNLAITSSPNDVFDQNVSPPNYPVLEAEPFNLNNNNSIKESSKDTPLKRKSDELTYKVPLKSPRLDKENDNFFGFDDSENQENMSPKKDKHHGRALRPRGRAMLQEINAITGPCRANIPLAAKTKFAPNSQTVNKMFDVMKSATEAPVLPEKNVETSTNTDPSWQNSAEANEESVHLFEDIDVVHHLKPVRKSYGKGKKLVTFCQTDIQETNVQHEEELSEEEEDLPFDNPTVKAKRKLSKKKKKPSKFTKKEEEEVEVWAAAFNSMCEDVDNFPLQLE